MNTLRLIRNVFDDDAFFFGKEIVNKSPSTITKRTEEGLLLEVAVPGCSKDDVSVEVDDGFLVIEATVQGTEVKKTYSLPSGADPDKVEASVKHGLLTITIPDGRKKRKVL